MYKKMVTKTFKFRIKDSASGKKLDRLSKAVNFVWNYCNEISLKALQDRELWLSKYDLNKLTAGSSKELGLHSQTINAVSEEFATRRKQFKKKKLRWRGKRSLGWIPFKKSGIKICEDKVYYQGECFKLFLSREIPDNYKCGSFSQDARGRWYFNIVVMVEEKIIAKDAEVGIDLGLKDLATLSNGKKYGANRYYRKYQRILALSQKDGKKRRIKNIHAKIKNLRMDNNHKISHEITRDFNFIAVGDASSSKLKKTNMAKSVSDAGWSQLRTFLDYKSNARGGLYVPTNEAGTTQGCSNCYAYGEAAGAPKGRKGLGIREWSCKVCGAVHDRDINSAVNILRIGRNTLLPSGHKG
jgi:transposase